MRESEHFNLFLAEGSDIVNPLVQDVQNYEAIDGQMFKNQNAGVQNATELKTGTVHAITRNVPDAQFITFTATSNYTAGETFIVDGVQVSALTVGGETLPTGAYVINSQVLCVLKGTLLTVYGVGTEVADNSLALNGHPDTYFGTKEEVDNAINTANAAKELVNEVNNSLSDIRTWKVLANTVPSTTATEWNLPTTDWKELEIRIGYSDDNNYCALRVVKAEIPSTGTQFRRGGYYYDSQNRMYVGIGFTKTKIGVSDFNYIAGGTSKNEYSTTIYYR